MEVCANDTVVRGVEAEKARQCEGFGHRHAGDEDCLAARGGSVVIFAVEICKKRTNEVGEGEDEGVEGQKYETEEDEEQVFRDVAVEK